MLVIGETLLVQTVQGAFNYFRQNLATLIPDIFGNLPPAEQQEWQTWLQNPDNQIFVFEGYPVQPQQLPCVAVVLGINAEEGNGQVLGELWGPWQSADSVVQVQLPSLDASTYAQQGMAFQTTYSLLVLAANHKQAKWISYLAWWALLANRQYLEAQGLYSQSLRAQELAPDQITLQQEAIYVYRRVLTLTASHVDTFTVIYPNPSIGQVSLAETANNTTNTDSFGFSTR